MILELRVCGVGTDLDILTYNLVWVDILTPKLTVNNGE